jgi:hypothetical protein
MSHVNQRLIAGDGLQIHSAVKNISFPPTSSVLLYENSDRLACLTQLNPTQRYVVGEVPPVNTSAASYACTVNDDLVLVDSSAHPQVSITLPDSPYIGKKITIIDASRSCLEHPISVTASVPVQHDTDVLMNTNGMSLTFVFTATAWLLF